MTLGYHQCPFCPAYPARERINGELASLGSAEIRVHGPTAEYAAPNLIYHYVIAHEYLPPDEFIEAVLADRSDWVRAATNPFLLARLRWLARPNTHAPIFLDRSSFSYRGPAWHSIRGEGLMEERISIAEFISAIERLPTDEPRVWYTTEKQHWLGWLSQYNTAGAYGRVPGQNHDARYAYNHVVNPPTAAVADPGGRGKPGLGR
jgi:hypothetical protein